MLLTEEEAKEKWCPQARKGEDNCAASQCMMWRKEIEPRATGTGCEYWGWCGLGGTPLEALEKA